MVSPRGGVALPAQHVPIGQGTYDLRLHFDVPRAQVVEYAVACPGAESQGALGEPFAAYRERRLAQLRAQREQDRRNASAVTSALVGAFVPNAQATVQSGPVRVDAQVAPGAAAIDMNVELAPGDVGGGPIEMVVHLVTTAPGACAVTAVADDPDVLGRFDVIHIRDLEREAADRELAATGAAEHARVAMRAQLVALGADTDARAKRVEQAARARAVAEAQAQHASAEMHARETADREDRARADAASYARDAAERARIAAEVRDREATRLRRAMEIREHWLEILISWGADVNYQARLRFAAEGRARAAAELEARRLRYAIELREHWRLLLISWGADAEWRQHQQAAHAREELALRARTNAEIDAEIDARNAAEARDLEAALRARGQLRAALAMLGARERPPMPALRIEDRGSVPFAGAVWTEGRWTWGGAAWQWVAGGWVDRSGGFGEAGGEAPTIAVAPPAVIVEAPVITITPVIMTTTTTTTTIVRDHRTVPARAESRAVRDHRTPAASAPKVRDHRAGH